MKSALITGANKGIGLATAKALGHLGYKLWIGARSQERGRAAQAELVWEGFEAEFVQLDVNDEATIRAAAETIAAASPSLDILINNAGITAEGTGAPFEAIPPSRVPVATLRRIYDTNFFGAVAVTQAMLPLLRRAPAARIVNVSSALGSFGLTTDENWPWRSLLALGYKSSKAALNMATVLFAQELKDTPIKVNAANPGLIATDLSGARAEDLAGRPGYGTTDEGARIIVRLATLPAEGPSGGFFDWEMGTVPW
jgi:NAD(P)-dependent dehydrogenase (short-subunit alcohol dehydrogenase family)